MSTQVSTFLILFLKTRLLMPLPYKSSTFKVLLVLRVAAKGSMHFSVILLLANKSISSLGASQTAFAICCTPSSDILLPLRSRLRRPP